MRPGRFDVPNLPLLPASDAFGLFKQQIGLRTFRTNREQGLFSGMEAHDLCAISLIRELAPGPIAGGLRALHEVGLDLDVIFHLPVQNGRGSHVDHKAFLFVEGCLAVVILFGMSAHSATFHLLLLGPAGDFLCVQDTACLRLIDALN